MLPAGLPAGQALCFTLYFILYAAGQALCSLLAPHAHALPHPEISRALPIHPLVKMHSIRPHHSLPCRAQRPLPHLLLALLRDGASEGMEIEELGERHLACEIWER